jgi:hypothetical protein
VWFFDWFSKDDLSSHASRASLRGGKTIMDVLTGSVLIPFAMMVAGIFLIPMYNYTIHASPLSTGLAGAFGAISVISELRKL